MRLKLYVVHGSHPCAAVEKALDMKGLPYGKIEWPPTMHAPMQKLIFGVRTVPALRIDRDEKISGSRAIMHRLDELVVEPPLYPDSVRAAVEEADRWGDAVFQPLGRTLTWGAFLHSPGAMVSYSEGSRLPLPAPAVRASAPLVARIAARLNRTDDDVARRHLAVLPGYLDRVDGYIAGGTIGDAEHPNAADLQLASTIRLLMALADVRPLIAGRPCEALAVALFPDPVGEMPAGSLPPVAA